MVPYEDLYKAVRRERGTLRIGGKRKKNDIAELVFLLLSACARLSSACDQLLLPHPILLSSRNYVVSVVSENLKKEDVLETDQMKRLREAQEKLQNIMASKVCCSAVEREYEDLLYVLFIFLV